MFHFFVAVYTVFSKFYLTLEYVLTLGGHGFWAADWAGFANQIFQDMRPVMQSTGEGAPEGFGPKQVILCFYEPPI